MKAHKINIAAGAVVNISDKGEFFRIMASTAEVLVSLEDGVFMPLAQGIAVRPRHGFDYLRVSSDVAQAVTIIVGAGEVDDSRLSLISAVSVIDGGAERTKAGGAFMGGALQAGGATLFSHIQLWNEAGSGEDFYVEQVNFTVSVATGIRMAIKNFALVAIISDAQCKAAGVASLPDVIRGEHAAAALVAAGDVLFSTGNSLPTATPIYYRFTEPVLIKPGYGLTLGSTTNAGTQGLSASFEFYTVPSA